MHALVTARALVGAWLLTLVAVAAALYVVVAHCSHGPAAAGRSKPQAGLVVSAN